MPFDEEPDDLEDAKSAPKVNLKKVSTQKSIFESMPKKPTQADLQEQVKKIEENNSSYKKKAAELSIAYKKAIMDKTLEQNKNVFIRETEQELLANMINLAIEVNNDPNEQEGMGSLIWIILLLKTCLAQRDKINSLEYELSQLKSKTDLNNLRASLLKEIRAEIDKKKSNG